MSDVRSGFLFKTAVIIGLCLLDLVINALADNRPIRVPPPNLPAIWVGIQFTIQFLNLIMLLMLFFGTYLFQVGLIGVLIKEFRGALFAMAAYAALFAVYAAVKLSFVNAVGEDGMWNLPGFVFISIVQKLGALCYYLTLLSTCASLGEPAWWSRGRWVAHYSKQQQMQAAAAAAAAVGASAVL